MVTWTQSTILNKKLPFSLQLIDFRHDRQAVGFLRPVLRLQVEPPVWAHINV